LTSLILANAAAGVVSGALADVGINDQFMKELAATLLPGSSALFVLTSPKISQISVQSGVLV